MMTNFLIMCATLVGLLLIAWLVALLAIRGMEKEQEKKRRERIEEWRRNKPCQRKK